jgi:primosomal protein N' (replication factor Y)
VALTWHSSDGTFRCHYCDRVEAARPACAKCGSPFFKHRGSGTQKAEKELKAHFPEARVLRLDSDSAEPRGAQGDILAAFGRREADVLLGTQMIAKGLDFHGVTFVGVVSADGSLHLPDFRSGERTFQSIVQVAGRAGRGRQPGRVIVQTRAPEHPSLTAAQAHDFAAFAGREASFRRELGYPPFGPPRRADVFRGGRGEGHRRREAGRLAVRAARDVWQEKAGERGAVPEGALELLGPAPSPMPKLPQPAPLAADAQGSRHQAACTRWRAPRWIP